MQIALVEPLIPQNTGNIARLCAGTNTTLHLIGPLGFSISDKQVRRAGLDYWPSVDLVEHDSFDAFAAVHADSRMWFLSAHANRNYAEIDYRYDDIVVLGSETTGLPTAVRDFAGERLLKIPINRNIRCLNLANAAAIVLFEALRQCGFPDAALRSKDNG